MPDLRTVVNEIVKADAGHTEAIYQAYFGPYRSMSPWEHAEAGSFRAGIVESEAGRSFVGERSPMDTDSLKRIAGSMFAYVLEIAASAIQSDLGAVLRVIRDELTTPLVSPPATS